MSGQTLPRRLRPGCAFRKSGLCLSSRSPGFGDGVVQYACTASDQYQRWKFEDNSQPDGPEVFRLRNAFWSSKCLGVGGGSTANAALLGVWDCSGTGPGANQSWVFTR